MGALQYEHQAAPGATGAPQLAQAIGETFGLPHLGQAGAFIGIGPPQFGHTPGNIWPHLFCARGRRATQLHFERKHDGLFGQCP
jgi:hypothetical protein